MESKKLFKKKIRNDLKLIYIHILVFLFIGLITVGLARSQTMPQCPPDGVHAIHYPGSCQRFIRCVNGNSVVQHCAPGLAFNIVRGQCDTEANAACNPCQGVDPREVIFIRDELDCARYTMCLGAVRSENQCGANLYFNPNINTCDHTSNVECASSGTTTTTTTLSPGPGDPTDPGTDATCNIQANFEIFASPTSCDRYTICACGHPQVRNCPPGLIFDVVSQSCNTRDQGHCLSETAPACPPDTVEHIAHPYDCRHLVLCILGSSTLEACPPGLEVNRRINKCDFPHVAQCLSRVALTYTQLMTGMLYV